MGTAALARRTRALLVAVVSASLLGLAAPSAGADDEVAPELSPITSVTGRLVSATGQPISGIRVSLCSPSIRDVPDPCIDATSGADGSFTIADVVRELSDADWGHKEVYVHTVDASVADRYLVEVDPAPVSLWEASPTVGEIVVPTAPIVHGRVVDQNGPVANARITAYRPIYPGGQISAQTTATEDGSFVLRPRHLSFAANRPAVLQVDADDHASSRTSVVLTGGRTVDVGTQTLALARSVSVTIASDAALDPVTVTVVGRGHSWSNTASTALRFDALGNGDFSASIDDPQSGFYSDPVAFTLSDSRKHVDVTVRARRFATLAGTVRSPDGRAVERGLLTVQKSVAGSWIDVDSVWIINGSVQFPYLRAGSYRLIPVEARSTDPLPSATGFTVAAGESRDLGVLTVEPFAMGYRHDVTITTPTVERTRVYDPDRLSVITASVISAAPMEGAEAVVLDGAGREVTSTLVTNGQLRFLMTRGAVGTHSGFRIHIPATYRSNAATSALVPPYTVTLRPTRVSTPRLSRSTVSRGGVVEVEVDVTHGDHGTLELLIDGKVAERTSMIPQGPGTTHTHLLTAPAPTVGKHTIAVRRVATATEAAATSAPATLTITKATLRGRPKVSAKTFRAGTKPSVTVTVPQTKHRAYATGKVRLYVGKKLVRTVTLKAKHRGRIVTTLPVRPTKAIKVRAVYAGSKDVVGATSKVTTIKAKPKVRR